MTYMAKKCSNSCVYQKKVVPLQPILKMMKKKEYILPMSEITILSPKYIIMGKSFDYSGALNPGLAPERREKKF